MIESAAGDVREKTKKKKNRREKKKGKEEEQYYLLLSVGLPTHLPSVSSVPFPLSSLCVPSALRARRAAGGPTEARSDQAGLGMVRSVLDPDEEVC